MPTAAVLTGVYAYGWLQARAGRVLADAPRADHSDQRSARAAIAGSQLARRHVTLRMRDGSRMTCRIVDSGGLLSVHADLDYDIPGVDWPAVRSIVDVGAHIGSFTVWAARRARQARLVAVEPNPFTFELLSENVRVNGLGDRVRLFNAAIAGAAGSGRLELVEHSLGTRLARDGAGEVSVEVMSMDSLKWAAALERIDVLKVDCEGMEYELFASVSDADLEGIGVIACEYHPVPGHDVTEIERRLESAGFRVRRPRTELGVLWATRPAQPTV